MTKDTYVSKTGQNERMVLTMTKTELKPIDELYIKINRKYAKIINDMPAYRKVFASIGVDLDEAIIAMDCVKVSSTNFDVHQKKFLYIMTTVYTIAYLLCEFDKNNRIEHEKEFNGFKNTVHQYDAPWYWGVVDQLRV